MMDERWLLPIFVSVALVSWVGVGGVRRLALRWGVVDVPNERSSHEWPVPLGGGLVLVGINVGAWGFFGFVHPVVSSRHALAFILGALLIATVGLRDDLGHVPYPIRLGIHAGAATVFMAGYGYWQTISVPLLGTVALGSWGILLTLLWIVGLTNAYNFMDGIDGMVAGQAVAAGVGWMGFGWLIGRPLLVTLGALLAASSLGFLIHNWHPARIFMGDAGSTLLGYSFAVLPIVAAHTDPRMALAGALLVWPAIFDSGFTVLRRLLQHENIFTGHRTFLFHRLVHAGWSHPTAALLYIPLPLLGAALAFTWEKGTPALHLAVAVLSASACAGLWIFVRHEERSTAELAQELMPMAPGNGAHGVQPQELLSLEALASPPSPRGTNGVTDYRSQLLAKLSSRTAQVAVIGLGYVGLPLAVATAEAGYRVVGIDVDRCKVDAINAGESFLADVPSAQLARLTTQGALCATDDFAALERCDAVSICVPTPLNKIGDPDISSIVAATEEAVKYLHPGMVFVLESTTYPGTTSEVVLPLLAGNGPGLQVGETVFLAYSPERIDPGRTDWTTRTTPRVIGGVTPACLEVAQAYYGQVMERLVPVSSTEAAEMAKLLENTFRAINIGLANEALLMCDKLGLDAWEVIEAAATKPFGFMKFTPGPGIGGHCIPVDPLYLSWRLKHLQYNARFIEVAREINTAMPGYWVQKVQDALNEAGKAVKGSRILVLGITYKKNVTDMRESPALDILSLLHEKGAQVAYHDPYVPAFHLHGMEMVSVPTLESALARSDCAILVTDHTMYDCDLLQRARILIDTRRSPRPRRSVGPRTQSHPRKTAELQESQAGEAISA